MNTNSHTGRARLARVGLAALAAVALLSAPALAGKKKPPSPHKKTSGEQPLGAPEIDPSLLAGGALLLVGGTLVLMGRRSTAPQA